MRRVLASISPAAPRGVIVAADLGTAGSSPMPIHNVPLVQRCLDDRRLHLSHASCIPS